MEQYLQETRLGLNIHTVGLQKKRDPFSIIEGEEDFGATFGVKTVQFTWQTVAFFLLRVSHLILDPGLV